MLLVKGKWFYECDGDSYTTDLVSVTDDMPTDEVILSLILTYGLILDAFRLDKTKYTIWYQSGWTNDDFMNKKVSFQVKAIPKTKIITTMISGTVASNIKITS